MSFYGLGTKILLDRLSKSVNEIKQVRLADGATGAGRLAHLLRCGIQLLVKVKKSAAM